MKSLAKVTNDELKNEFVSLTVERHAASAASVANKLFQKRLRIHRELRRRGHDALKAFEPLLTSEQPEVRLAAAYVCLETTPSASLKVLSDLLNDNDFFIAAPASGILDCWSRKMLTFPDPDGRGFSKVPSYG